MDDVVFNSESEQVTLQLHVQENETLQVLSPNYSPDLTPQNARKIKKKLGKRRLKNPAYYKIVPELKRRFTRDRRSEVEVRDIEQLLNRQSGVQGIHKPICKHKLYLFSKMSGCFDAGFSVE